MVWLKYHHNVQYHYILYIYTKILYKNIKKDKNISLIITCTFYYFTF